MQPSSLVIRNLASARQALDLGNSLMCMSGVSHVNVDKAARMVTVEYDPQYTSEGALQEFIRGAGYTLNGDENAS